MIKVLIVDDDHVLCLINKKLIEVLGYKVIGVANNGNDAVRLAAELQPDVVLMDIRINGERNGIEVMKEISKRSDARAIYLTGNSEQSMKDQAKLTNMLAFCVKPIHIEELREILEPLNDK